MLGSSRTWTSRSNGDGVSGLLLSSSNGKEMLMRHWQFCDQNSRSSQRCARARCCAVCGVTPVHLMLEARDLNNRDPSRYLLRERGSYPVPEFQATHDRRSSLRHNLILIKRNKFQVKSSQYAAPPHPRQYADSTVDGGVAHHYRLPPGNGPERPPFLGFQSQVRSGKLIARD